jgi:CHAT domain-containing protein/Tfp pilus assembly protein PilF
MVRFALSSAGWLCTIGLLTTAIPVLALPEGPITQSTLPAPANVEQLLAIGKAQAKKGDFEGAIGTYRQALSIAEAAHNLPQQLSLLEAIGDTYQAEGDVLTHKPDYLQAIKIFEQSLEPYQQALKIARQIPNRQSEWQILLKIAGSYWDQGHASRGAGQEPAKRLTLNKQSLQFLQQALVIAKDLKNAELVKLTLQYMSLRYDSMASAYEDLKQYDAELEQVKPMYTIAKELGSQEIEKLAADRKFSAYQSLSDSYYNPEHYDQHIEVTQKFLALGKKLHESESLLMMYELGIADIYAFRGQYTQALEAYKKILAHAHAVHDVNNEDFAVGRIGNIYSDQAKYSEALVKYQQVLQSSQTRHDRTLEAGGLNNISIVYTKQGKYAPALDFAQQALAMKQEDYERYSKGMTAENIREYCAGQTRSTDPAKKPSNLKSQVCDHPDKPLPGMTFNLAKKIIDQKARLTRVAIGKSFNNIAQIYSSQGDYIKAAEYTKKSLEIAREMKDSDHEATSLNNMGAKYAELGNYREANDLLQESLKITIAQKNRVREVFNRNNLGAIASAQGDYPKALEEYQKSLALSQKLEMRSQTANLLTLIGNVYQSQGTYTTAFSNYQQALEIQQKIGEPDSIAAILLRRGNLERQLGQHQIALSTHQEVLGIAQKIGAKRLEALAFLAIATDYREQGQLDNALKGYNQALEIATSIDDLNANPQALYGIGQLYAQQNQPDKALTYLNQALAIQQRTGVKPRQAETLSAIGQVQTQLGKYAEAQTTLQQAYALAQTVGDRATEAIAFANLGQLADRQKQPEIAILFYKQSVNTYESIRQNLLSLAQDQQKSYAETIANTYRTLAQLLIAQKRFPEAQAVLELLKLRELKDYTRQANIQSPGIQSPGISLGKTETAALNEILTKFKSLSEFSQKLDQCQPEKCRELLQLRDQNNTEILAAISKQRTILAQAYATQTTLKPEQLDQLAAPIVNAQPGTVLIYPIVFKDKIQFLLAFKAGDGAFTYRPFEQQVDSQELYKTIVSYREQLKTPGNLNALKATSQKLYNWLIKPLEPELNQPNIKHIVLAPDSVTRYIPFATLYDGQKYLIQRYSISTVNAATTTDVSERFPQPKANRPFLLAMGASTFPQSTPRLSDLNSVPAELNAIVKINDPSKGIYPGAQFLNETFSYTALQDNLKNYQILHIATHGKADVGRSENSFIVAGNSTPITLAQIQTLQKYGLNKIHLVVLSACETAVGGNDADGMEMAGLSQAFLGGNAAKSVLASLWSVDDDSTALSMMQFYQKLAQGNITKAEALQQVQTDFINHKFTPVQAKAMLRYVITSSTPTQSRPRSVVDDREKNNYSHPFYWAPFILIGNSL